MITSDDPIPLLHFRNLEMAGVVNFITTREGGVSRSPFNSLNLGLHTHDNFENVIQNRSILASAVRISPSNFVYAQQIHSGKAIQVTKEDISNSASAFSPETDALITDIHGISLMVMVADCVPVLLYDPVRGVIAAIHAGWRGTVKKIVCNTIGLMKSHYHCSPADLLAGIGPSSGPCCYEVGDDVKQEVVASFGFTAGVIHSTANSKYLFDLWQANHKQLIDCGVEANNIEISGMCTQCNPDIFFSSRASHGVTGRFAAGICIL